MKSFLCSLSSVEWINLVYALRELPALTHSRQHVSRSTVQQASILRTLNRDSPSGGRGAAAPILQYVVSTTQTSPKKTAKIDTLQRELTQTFRKAQREEISHKLREIHLSQEESSRACRAFLAGLKYNNMRDRESRVARAHESTLRWALKDSRATGADPSVCKWVNFGQWLESDDQMYWVTGKSGSGKSTFVKYMCSQERQTSDSTTRASLCRCHPYLKNWAGNHDLIVASFYFWSSGIGIQTGLSDH